jgi:hypothetical protein
VPDGVSLARVAEKQSVDYETVAGGP